MALPIPVIKYRMLTRDATSPLVGGKVYTYAAGTLNLQNTWTDSLEGTLNANPVILDQYGEANIWVGDVSYKFAIYDANDVLQYTVDNVINSGSSGSFSTVESISDLRNIPSGSSTFVYVGYNTVPADEGGGTFIWDSASAAADDNGTIVTPASSPTTGRWLRQYTEPLDPHWFGAKGSNDGAAITNAAAAALTLGSGLLMTAGGSTRGYNISTSISFPDPVIVTFEPNAVINVTGANYIQFNTQPIAGSYPLFSGNSAVIQLTPAVKQVRLSWYKNLSQSQLVASLGVDDPRTLIVDVPWVLTGNLTLLRNTTVKIEPGCQISGAYTLTINGDVTAGNYQLFNPNTLVHGIRDVNVKWFGAFGDGVTNDAVYIQKAIDCVASTTAPGIGGGVVYFPAAIYRSGPLLVSTAFTSIRGDGATASEIQTIGNGTSLLKFYGGAIPGNPLAMASFIEDIKISYAGGTWTNLLHLVNLSWMNLRRLWIEGDHVLNDYAFHTESALTYWMDDCIIRGAKFDSMLIEKLAGGGQAYPNSVVVQNCEVQGGQRWGVHFKDGAQFQLSGCSIEHNGGTNDANHGAILIDSADFEAGQGCAAAISHCHLEDNTGVQVKVNALGFAASYVIINDVQAVSPASSYGLHMDVTSPDRCKVYVDKSTFFNATVKDIYVINDAVAIIRDTESMTTQINKRCTAVPYPNGGQSGQVDPTSFCWSPQEFNDNASTENGGYYGNVKILSNTIATTLNSMIGFTDGGVVTFYSLNGNTTIKNRASGGVVADEFDCPGGIDYKLQSNECVSFVRVNGHFYTCGQDGQSNRYKYAEGLYIPTLTCGTSGTITLSGATHELSYTRVGRMVQVTGRVDVSAVAAPVGSVTISLPLVARSNDGGSQKDGFTICPVFIEHITLDYPPCMLRVNPGAASAVFLYNSGLLGADTAWSVVPAALFTGNEEISVNFTYFTD